MDPGGADKRPEESVVQVPSRGGGNPQESKEPQLPPRPNPELQDDRKLVEMVSGTCDVPAGLLKYIRAMSSISPRHGLTAQRFVASRALSRRRRTASSRSGWIWL
jgi:hypothetical protein